MPRYLLYALARPILGVLPLPLLTALGVVAGIASFALQSGARRAVFRNLAVVLPQAGPRALRACAFRVFIHAAWSYIEQLGFTPARAALLRRGYSVTGWQHVERAHAQGRGIIMVGAHLGGTLAAGSLVSEHGIPTSVVVEEIRPPRLFDLFMRVRSAQGLRLIPSNRPAVRVIVAALRRNEIVGLLCDRDVQGTGRALAFFGRPTLLTTAPAALALRTGAVVLPSVAYRQALYRGAGYVGEPIEMPRTGDTEADVQEGSQRIVRCLESLIRAHPEQWTVFTDVWPSAGPGIDDST